MIFLNLIFISDLNKQYLLQNEPRIQVIMSLQIVWHWIKKYYRAIKCHINYQNSFLKKIICSNPSRQISNLSFSIFFQNLICKTRQNDATQQTQYVHRIWIQLQILHSYIMQWMSSSSQSWFGTDTWTQYTILIILKAMSENC